jgi:hypothetical protein
MTAGGPAPAWRPILQGSPADQALTVVEEIAAALLPLTTAGASHPELVDWSLFFAYLDRAASGHGHLDRAAELLERAVGELGRGYTGTSLFSGFPGVAWLVEHLKGWVLEDDEDDDPGEEVAVSLRDFLGRSPWLAGHDLISGLAGLGVYALERGSRPWGWECLERTVARLDETAERLPEGVAWRTLAWMMGPEAAKLSPRGHFDLGVAHGVPGVVSFLAQASAAGVEARPLLDDAISWILAQKLPPGERSIFPNVVSADRPGAGTRIAWCYGDLGLAAALLLAARCTGETAWEEEALEIARTVARRDPETSGVVDAGLCHGAAGNAHLFNRFFQATGDPLFVAAARFWLERTFALRRPGEGVAGYSSWAPGDGGSVIWEADPSLLSGAAGIGLALLAAASPIEPAWDRLLLVSIPAVP